MIDKKAIIAEFGKNENDTGSTEVQIALLTARINNLTAHLKNNKQDKHSTRGLQMMNSQRRALLRYLEQEDIERCRAIKKKLGLRGQLFKLLTICGEFFVVIREICIKI